MAFLTTISTIRHAQTTYNVEKRYAGTIDAPLSDTGIRESREASMKLQRMKFNVVIASTLQRTIDTARLLVGDDIPIVRNELCNERNYGILEGLTWDDVKSVKPAVMFIEVGDDTHSVNPLGGEPFEDLRERAKKFHRFIFKNHKGANILVVSHGVFLQQYHGLIRGLSCIESLAKHVAKLELNTFRFKGSRLIEEKLLKLSDSEQSKW